MIQFQLFTAIIIYSSKYTRRMNTYRKWIGSIYFKKSLQVFYFFMMSSAHNSLSMVWMNEQNHQNPIKVRLSFTNFHLTFGTSFIVMTHKNYTMFTYKPWVKTVCISHTQLCPPLCHLHTALTSLFF